MLREVSDEEFDPAVRQYEEEFSNLELLLENGRDEYALRTLDERGGAQELVRQQYSGRYPFELLQNANDAARETGASGRAAFLLTEKSLLVADNGTGFGEPQVRSICSLGRSSKGPGTSIGHKGLGFKSVGEITDRPQIISSGTSFQFDAARLSRDLRDLFTDLPAKQRFPVYAFPYRVEDGDTEDDAEQLARLKDDGFTTVIRLPMRSGVERATVAQHLVKNLYPRLLLFLPGIDHLELRGTDSDFSAEVARHEKDGIEHALIETADATEEWLVYRGTASPTSDILSPMGEEWAAIQEVNFAVAIPLDNEEQPVTSETFPLNVYFPTEEELGLHVAVHAEWVLTMDRRRIAESPEAIAFNRFLLESVAEFVATSVAVDLVERCGRSAASIKVLMPPASKDDDRAAARFAHRWQERLSDVAFLPFCDNALHRPVEAKLLPAGIPDLYAAHELTDLPAVETLRPDIEGTPAIRSYVASVSNRLQRSESDFLSLMTSPTTETVHALYSFLVEWHEKSRPLLSVSLKHVPCVLTTNGQFLTPASQAIFFPRRDSTLPDDFPVPIAIIPEVEGTKGLLSALGVKEFEWRELIREYLVKILEDPDAASVDRERAMDGLRTYQRDRRSGGEEVSARLGLGRVLVPTRRANGKSAVELRRADSVYFGSDWTGAKRLEQIYGPFDESEFLVAAISEDADDRRAELDFYRMLGVIDHPRLESVNGHYALGGLRHPHGNDDTQADWLGEHARKMRVCPEGHDTKQEITVSHKLDRFADVVRSGEPHRLLSLWEELALHWGKVYEDGLISTVRCNHGWHSTDKERDVESLFGFLLRTLAWVPVELGGKVTVAPPGEAWVVTTELPQRIRARIRRIDERMLRTRGGSAMVADLGLIESGRPSIDALLGLLKSMADEADDSSLTGGEVDFAARWVQRAINDVLPVDAEPHPAPREVRVLASHCGSTLFVSQPPFAEDALLRDTWEQHLPLLFAETGLNRLTSYLGLVKLDDAVTTVPIPYEVHRGTELEDVRGKIDAAKPHIFALVIAENSSAVPRVRSRLRKLELVVCDRLVLKYTYEGEALEREDATCYIATHVEVGGRTSRVGTVYLELSREAREPDWFAFGRQLAQHLEVAAHADAITMLLKMDRADRERMMHDRQITPDHVAKARDELQLPLEDEREARGALEALTSATTVPGVEPAGISRYGLNPQPDDGVRASTATHEVAMALGHSDPEESDGDPSPPEIVWEAVKLVNANPAEIATKDRVPKHEENLGADKKSTAPSVESQVEKVATGKRGEEIAYRKERERVAQFGGNPDAVFWQSKEHELAPVDIISYDESGNQIYIEVKATSATDPATPFSISNSELLAASAYGDSYHIYRVTDTNTATPQVTRWANPMKLIREKQGRLMLAGAQMELGLVEPPGDSGAEDFG